MKEIAYHKVKNGWLYVITDHQAKTKLVSITYRLKREAIKATKP